MLAFDASYLCCIQLVAMLEGCERVDSVHPDPELVAKAALVLELSDHESELILRLMEWSFYALSEEQPCMESVGVELARKVHERTQRAIERVTE